MSTKRLIAWILGICGAVLTLGALFWPMIVHDFKVYVSYFSGFGR